MSQKRRDNRGRVLRNGESQRKDGRYAYKYAGLDGKDKFVYSWKLEKTDRLPAGKRDGLSLREKEKQIQRDLDDGIYTDTGNMKVLDVFKRYLELKKSLKYNSVKTYAYVYKLLTKEYFGMLQINKVMKSDVQKWMVKLQNDGRSYKYIALIKSTMGHAFQMAIDDKIIRENPFTFRLKSVVKDDTVSKKILTKSEENNFLKFVKESGRFRKYYEALYILFNTGVRISELAGLTIDDIDFENNLISINHQLLRKESGEYYIESPKSQMGSRKIPMTDEVSQYFEDIISKRNAPDIEPVVDGKTGFIFLDRHHRPTTGAHWRHRLQSICKRYNEINENHPIKVTPHICRHTFCSRMANAGMNPKALQYIMGHADISITLNVYTHIDEYNIWKELNRVINSMTA